MGILPNFRGVKKYETTVDGRNPFRTWYIYNIKPCKYWDIDHISTGDRRISEPSTIPPQIVFTKEPPARPLIGKANNHRRASTQRPSVRKDPEIFLLQKGYLM